MRQIKFRAFDKKEKTMFYDINLLSSSKATLEWSNGAGGGEWVNPDGKNYEVMQFTGLKDKNGKDVFEGDIVKWNDELLEVRWGKCGWILFGKLFKKFGFPNGDTCCEIQTNNYLINSEVIGNIYENTELLTK